MMSQEHAEELPLPTLILQLSRDQAHLYERQFGMSQSRLMLLRELMQTGEISQAWARTDAGKIRTSERSGSSR